MLYKQPQKAEGGPLHLLKSVITTGNIQTTCDGKGRSLFLNYLHFSCLHNTSCKSIWGLMGHKEEQYDSSEVSNQVLCLNAC